MTNDDEDFYVDDCQCRNDSDDKYACLSCVIFRALEIEKTFSDALEKIQLLVESTFKKFRTLDLKNRFYKGEAS